MNNIRALIILVSIYALTSCSDDDQTPAEPWSVNITSVTDSSATLSWAAKLDTSNSANFYQLWLNKILVFDSIKTNKFAITKLKHSIKYNVVLKAISNKNNILESYTSFETAKNYPPSDFSISLDSLSSTQVILTRGTPRDPERKKITYELTLNGTSIEINQQSTRIVIKGLQSGQTSKIKLIAKDNVNNATSKETTILVPPASNALLFRHRINNRECTVYLPSQYSKNSKTAMIIYFHGATGYGWNDAQSRGWREVAERENIIIAYPQALGEPTGWGVESRYPTDDLPYATQLISDLLNTYAVDPKRVYACGMSSGGFMTNYVGLFLSDKLAAIAPVAGLPTTYNFNHRTIKTALPLLHIHCTKDDIVKYASTDGTCLTVEESIAFWVSNNQCSTTPIVTKLPDINKTDNSTTTLYEYPNPTNGAKVMLYKINGGGHWWPGEKYGETDFVAEDVIWNFFKNFSKP